jgi:monodictyphenone polyketide synthase
MYVQKVSESIESRDPAGTPDSWAYVVNDVEPNEVQSQLDRIQSSGSLPRTSKIFLSAKSKKSVTISGPPQRLKALFTKSQFFRESQSIALPVYGGLCHASHVYNRQDAEDIIHSAPLYAVRSDFRVSAAIHSTSSGMVFTARTASDLYHEIIMELLTHSICWDEVTREVAEKARVGDVSDIRLYSFGNSRSLDELRSALQQDDTQDEVAIHNVMSWLSRDATKVVQPRDLSQSKLAIVGMSCRLPGGATDTKKFWDILEQGLDVSREIPPDRFDISTHFDPTGEELNKSSTKYGCFLDEPGMFDAPFFNMSPREAQTVDPQMRLALVTAYEALEQSGYVGNRTPSTRLERVGTYYGQAADDYREVNQGQSVSTYYIPGGCRAFGPGRVNYFFKFAGPSYSIDTACSSGLAAVEVSLTSSVAYMWALMLCDRLLVKHSGKERSIPL